MQYIPKFPKLFLCFTFTSNIFDRVQKFHYIILFNKEKCIYSYQIPRKFSK